MQKQKAIYYGKVNLIPDIICDGYVLDDGTAVMSLLATAELLSMHHRALQNIANKGIPKSIKLFWSNDLNLATKTVKVVAKGSHYKDRFVEVCDSNTIEFLIKAYAFAFANDNLRENQKHIGKRCVFLMGALIKTALETAIKESCGFIPEIQKTIRKNYITKTELIKDLGFNSKVPNNIATVEEITKFLGISKNTFNKFIKKHKKEISPTKLDIKTIRSLGSNANRMNGYTSEQIVKIAFNLNTEVTTNLKKRMFSQVVPFIDFQPINKNDWKNLLLKIFKNFNLHCDYQIKEHFVDFYIEDMALCLDCKDLSLEDSNTKEETLKENIIKKSYGLIRFNPSIAPEMLFNGILQTQKGIVTNIYSLKDFSKKAL